MISFELTEEQKLAQSMVQELAGAQLRPAARGADDRECIPSSILDEIWATGIIQSQAEAGGYSPTLNALLLEELAVADASFAIAAAAPIGFLGAIATQGSPAQKKNLLPLFAGDKYRCAGVAIMEPDFAFDVSSIRTAAIKTREGYRLSGMKGLVPFAADLQSLHRRRAVRRRARCVHRRAQRQGSERWREEAEHRTARARNGDRQFQRG